MSNPWLKKNPFMSMWLSGVNRAAGAARGQAAAQTKRQTQSTAAASSKAVADFWTASLGLKPAARGKKRR